MGLVKVSKAKGSSSVTIFQIQDRVNMGNSEELEQAGKDAYKDGTRDLIIDISKVDSITSAGIKALIMIYKLLAGDQGKKSKHVKLVSPTANVKSVLEIAGVTDLIDFHDTLDEAVASF